MKKRIQLLILTLITALSVMAQEDSVRISLITCYPGSDVYELYGHTELRVQNGKSDLVYNYGIFDFNAPGFVYRFVKGDTDYMVMGYPSIYMMRGYETRKVVEQTLNLTQEQARMVKSLLEDNAKEENATYRYNYVYDNCATRPRDIVEKATGGTIEYPAMTDTLTFRHEMRKYNANYSWQQFGIDLALGSGLDYVLNYREQMFVPMVLMKAFDGATIVCDSKRVPLVAETIELNPGSDMGDVLPATPWWQSPMMMSALLLLLTTAVTMCDIRNHKVTRWYDTALFTVYALAGCLVFFLIFISTHAATSPNLNGVWLNPFYLIPAILVWIKSARKVLCLYHFLNFAILIVLLLAWSLLPQEANAAFFLLMICPAIRSLNYIIINKCVRKGK